MIHLSTLIRDMLHEIGEDVEREGLEETPQRAARAWLHWTQGYGVKPKDVLKTFKDGGETYDEMILVKDIPFYSHCEHHLAPFFGTVDIGYIPNGRVVGASKLARALDILARRPQIQERLTDQLADTITKSVRPDGVIVVLRAEHQCMSLRGIEKSNSRIVTTASRGTLLNDAEAKQEFYSMLRET